MARNARLRSPTRCSAARHGNAIPRTAAGAQALPCRCPAAGVGVRRRRRTSVPASRSGPRLWTRGADDTSTTWPVARSPPSNALRDELEARARRPGTRSLSAPSIAVAVAYPPCRLGFADVPALYGRDNTRVEMREAAPCYYQATLSPTTDSLKPLEAYKTR
ncbi:hypothetical protein PsYK624_170520 [Phanerochaete sordida]|uniref:Uncharacterized protein n=1 Tax=Phanerochaete sordida TaxID=48140 RepID=A0A9P3LMU6_9APHY|nr:hypothetical protein PsYK624_170520 [Phanerochaete sordida]